MFNDKMIQTNDISIKGSVLYGAMNRNIAIPMYHNQLKYSNNKINNNFISNYTGMTWITCNSSLLNYSGNEKTLPVKLKFLDNYPKIYNTTATIWVSQIKAKILKYFFLIYIKKS